MKFDDIVKTLHFIRPNAEWVLRGDSIDDLEWLDENLDKPTDAELKNGFASYLAFVEKQEKDAADKRQAAEDKLVALGLTADDLKALGLA